MESMKARLLTAAIGVPLSVGILILGEHFHWVMYVIVSLLSVIMIFELLSAAKLHNNIHIFIPCMVYGIIQPILIPFKLGYFTLYAFVLVMFLIMIKNHKSITYPKLCFALLGTVIIVFGLSSILLLPPMYDNYFTFFFVFCVGVPWCADAGAYFAGVFFGKHKLSPVISPNKTVEGFIGGLAAGTISSVLIPIVYTFLYPNPHFDILLLVFVGLLCSIVSVAGDLSFSLIKRSCKIKDYGSIFPGHGGFLDRFDSVIFAAPIVYFIGKYFILFTI
jgi:phosphatidate cytidylyltransferase